MNSIETYQSIGAYSEVLGASSHRQIQLLLEKLLSNLSTAITLMNEKNIPMKCKRLSNATDIIGYLRDCLQIDDEFGVAAKLDAMYAHLERQLLLANSRHDPKLVEACLVIVTNIKTAWDGLS